MCTLSCLPTIVWYSQMEQIFERIMKPPPLLRLSASSIATLIAMALTACGGGGSSSSVSPQTYSLSATISGLNSSGLMLMVNGTTVSVAAGATTQALASSLASGTSYAVTVQTQPTDLVCTVSNGSGTVGAADVTSIVIACVSNFTLLYSFEGPPSDGQEPLAGLIQGSDGNFFGTTEEGGTSANCFDNVNGLVLVLGCGTVFEISPSGAESVLYSFAGGSSDGANPNMAGLFLGSDGNFYGTTVNGGASAVGTVFEITSSGTETVLHSFAGGSDGSYPAGGLIQRSDGNFYGTTEAGGSSDDGTVFMITPSGTETILHSFAGGSSDGALPFAGLILGSDGNFYGTTEEGGTNNAGTVFMITPSGAETVLYSFGSFSGDGVNPYAVLLQGSDGNFYGTTEFGGANNVGTVFKLMPSGTETILHSFVGGSSDGASPRAGVIQGNDGNFYGMTFYGGTSEDGTGSSSDAGTIFKLTPSGTETILHFFTGGSSDGAGPDGTLIQGSDGNFYGTTANGGISGDGTVFKLTLQ